MKQRGKSDSGFPRLMPCSHPIGRVYFTIYFTVQGGGRPPAEVDCDNIRLLSRSTQSFGNVIPACVAMQRGRVSAISIHMHEMSVG
jgi:hypothetical protein